MIISSSTNMINLSSSEPAESAIPLANKVSRPDLKLPEPVSDHLFLNNIRPEQAREFLLNHINRRLEVSAPPPIRGATDYSEDVSSVNAASNQIIYSVNRALKLNSNDNNAKINEVTDSVSSAFAEARDILKNLNILRREFLSEFNDIQKNVSGFLENIPSKTSTQTLDHIE